MKIFNQIKRKYLPVNLQLFADTEDGDGTDNTGDGDDDQNNNNEQSGEKTFTQKELDEAIEKRLARERKKFEKKLSAKETKEGKPEDKPEDKKAADENNQKLTALEEKVLCYDHDVKKEYSKEAIALAKAYVDEDTDMDEALEKVIKKFPMFVKSTKADNDEGKDETDNKESWGQRQKGSTKKVDPVEEAFLRKNPGLNID